jgi:hypothetical protein
MPPQERNSLFHFPIPTYLYITRVEHLSEFTYLPDQDHAIIDT